MTPIHPFHIEIPDETLDRIRPLIPANSAA